MGKIICFMGKSSTGKDTVFRKLLDLREPELSVLVPYTTRPVRDGETDGVEYRFTDENGYLLLSRSGKIIEERTYDTYYGVWRYFMVDDGNIDLKHKNYAMIGTLEAYNKFCCFFGKDRIVPVLIEVDDGIRLKRALYREMRQESPKYEEMCRRFLADCEDFSEEKIKEAGIDRRFYNNNFRQCLKEIREYIAEQIGRD